MTDNVDIFKDGQEVSSSWATFKKIGDSVQGTYVGNSKAIDSYQNPQTIYELKQKNGTIIKVGFRDTKTPIHDRMRNIRFGQIIGFKYTEDVPSKEKGRAPMKNIRIFADEKAVDKEWLDAQKTLSTVPAAPAVDPSTVPGFGDAKAEADFNALGATPIDNSTSPFPRQAAKVVTDEERIVRIAELAREKLGVKDPTQAKDRVMEATNLAFIPVNYEAIIGKLESLSAI